MSGGADESVRAATPSSHDLRPAPPIGDLVGRPVTRIEIAAEGERGAGPTALRRVRLGEPFTAALARRAMRELMDSGRYAEVDAEALPEGRGVLLRIRVVPRRIAADVRLPGGVLDYDETLRAARIKRGDELTKRSLAEHALQIRNLYARRGYPRAQVRSDTIDTDDAMRVVVVFEIAPGPPRAIVNRRFEIAPRPDARLTGMLEKYRLRPGDRADIEDLERADRDLQVSLQQSGWHRARVSHRIETAPGGARLVVVVDAGPRLRPRFEGNLRFDADQLLDALDLEETEDRSPVALQERLRRFYVERGFLDVEVHLREIGGGDDPVHDLLFTIRERQRVRVVAREYPCLTGTRSAADVGREIDGLLSESLPGDGFVGAVDSRVVDATFGARHPAGARAIPLELNPWQTYVPGVYQRAAEHLQELYRSEGYLSALVGPVVVLRRACDPSYPPNRCVPLGRRRRPVIRCPTDEAPLPVEDPPPPPEWSCVPDPARGIRCEPEVVLHVPIKLGPQAVLWDISFEGNRELVERRLADVADLELGVPVSQVELDRARLRILDEYGEEGFAFASVEAHVDLSPDRTRGRARFVISERERVRVRDVIVRGARTTNEALILKRVRFRRGAVFRRSDVRLTEERLATLGVFANVAVRLEDPEIPAKEKVVVVTVRERPPQYLDVRPGFSTGEGVRVTFEYGHRNLGGEAIQLTLRVQLGYLPTALILDRDVRPKLAELELSQRLERRNTASIEFPEIGFGPLFRLGVDGLDVRDNARDFGLTKHAAIVTLSYRPTTRFTAQLGGSLELNDAQIFGSQERGALEAYLIENPRAQALLRVPEGRTFAVAQRTGITWDRRDNPFGATQGTLVALGVEHVQAFPASDNPEPITSHFLRNTARLAGYLRLSDGGLSLAAILRAGYNTQLVPDSQTYPDRLFYMGGVDSIRGFLQDAMIPQDIAERIMDPEDTLTDREVVVRGGDFFFNPRLELRIPLAGIFQTAVFLDTGNLWVRPESANLLLMRYAAGSGLRATTPIGPVALDFGVNLDRRPWEDPWAIHFAIGLF